MNKSIIRKAILWMLEAFIIFLVSCNLTFAYNAAWPTEEISGVAKCDYRIVWKLANNTPFTSSWKVTACEATIDFNDLADWEYYLELRSRDSWAIWSASAYWDWAYNDSSNKIEHTKIGPYKIDTTPPTCVLKNITLKANKSDNQYFNNWIFYYKGKDAPNWEFTAKIEYKDNPIWSWISKIKFEDTIGAWATVDKPEWTATLEAQNYTHTYNWNWVKTYSSDMILSGNTKCIDHAWNEAKVSTSASSTVTYEDVTWTPSLPLTALKFQPDTANPDFTKDNITFKNWNFWAGSMENLFNWNAIKYLAAYNDRELLFKGLTDNWSGLRKFNIYIENPLVKETKDLKNSWWSSYSSRITSIADVTVKHDFRNVDTWNNDTATNGIRNYDIDIKSEKLNKNTNSNSFCDNVGNCYSLPDTEFKIVANEQSSAGTTKGWTAFSASVGDRTKVGNNEDSEKNDVIVSWKDIYGNSVVPVPWVKELVTNVAFTNTMWKNQISSGWPSVWDGIDFSFWDWTSEALAWWVTAWKYHSFIFTGSSTSDYWLWTIKIDIKSIVPTSNKYKDSLSQNMYQTNAWKISIDSLNLKTNSKNWYTSIWANSFLEAIPASIAFEYTPAFSVNSTNEIFPIIESKDKNLLIKWSAKNSKITGYQYKNKLITNNLFLGFKNISYTSPVQTYNILEWSQYYLGANNVWGIWWTAGELTYKSWSYNDSVTNNFKFTPKSIWWVTNENTKVAMYSLLRYSIWSKLAQLPAIQTWLWNYQKITDVVEWTQDIINDNDTYNSNSDIIFAEVDIRWISQTSNVWALTNATWAVTTSSTETKFNDFSAITLYDLKTNINQNVAQIMAWKERKDSIDSIVGWTATVNSLENIWKWLLLENDDIAYFNNTDVIIDCNSWWACNLWSKKTLIVENWKLTIKSDIAYTSNNAVLWIILLGETQLSISENITNMAWIVYSEWPVVSVNGAWTIYDWVNITEASLLNQLYWKWSIASRNTVWWSIKEPAVCPYWTEEYQNGCNKDNAKKYDLIYLRRYARVNQDLYGITTNPMWDAIAPYKVPFWVDKVAVKIAWWTTIKLNWAWSIAWTLPKPAKPNPNAPLIVEYDANLLNNPPYWFSKN
ncbi:MAG: hypothetical protein ACD_3C00051G0009 [uncultured bacterium (gcode 4)]|uniref:Uncharacterized protein n=1 Tax=uncultured bacterium (gcode 4) TaxID=1234023 RepID=K2FBK1_9BACT|nr:MAG: hypothetical protein ACD_3C00051G0009 [uncultured bacterium (gcode 4)]